MQPREVVGLILGLLGIALALIGLRPDQWGENLWEWHTVLATKLGLLNLATLLVSCVLIGYIINVRRGRQFQVIRTRDAFWRGNIESIVARSEKLIVLDTYQGHKHSFWNSVETRLNQADPFHLVLLMLDPNDEFLKRCLRLLEMSDDVCKIDHEFVDKLRQKRQLSPYGHNKVLEFFYWTGTSPGPIMSWTVKGREAIGLGFWFQLKESTDLTPYIILYGGPVFTAVKRHYERLIGESRPLP